jgi:hypothetical protein
VLLQTAQRCIAPFWCRHLRVPMLDAAIDSLK